MSSPDPNFDARLDAELRDVAVPAGLLERLRRIAALRDEELDALLGDVPVPAELEPRLLRIGRRAERWLRVRRAALAASLLVGLGIGYFAAVLGELATMRGGVARRGPALTAQIALQGRQEQPGDSAAEGVWIVAQEKHPSAEPTAEPMPPAPEVALGAESPADNSPLAETRRLFAGRENPAGLDPLGDRVLQEWPHVLAGPSRLDDLPEFREVPGLKARGVAMPLVPQYDHGFEIRFGVHPFAVPAANPQLRSSLVPLAVDTASYDLARKLLQGASCPRAARCEPRNSWRPSTISSPRPPARTPLPCTWLGRPIRSVPMAGGYCRWGCGLATCPTFSAPAPG